jgi:hypothetical protein
MDAERETGIKTSFCSYKHTGTVQFFGLSPASPMGFMMSRNSSVTNKRQGMDPKG